MAEIETNYNLFLDMDGLFYDFNSHVINLFGNHPDDFKPAQLWRAIENNKTFFLTMPLIEDWKKLWDATNVYGIRKCFLSGAPANIEFCEQKRQAIARDFPGTEVFVVKSEDKNKFSSKGKILIDDRMENVTKWREKGGHGILHFTTNQTIKVFNSFSNRVI